MDNPEKPAPQVTQDEEKQINYISIYNLLINYHISFFFISTSVKGLWKYTPSGVNIWYISFKNGGGSTDCYLNDDKHIHVYSLDKTCIND